MRVWVEVFDNADVRQGVVYNIKSAAITRKLDGAGSVQVTTPGTDQRALELLSLEARVRVFIEQDGDVREAGRGIVRQPVKSDNAGGTSFRVDCPEELIEVKDRSVLLGRIYGGAGSPVTLESVVVDLVGLVDGWTASVESAIADTLVSARFDGVSVLKALQYMAENYGYHLRQSIGSKTLEFGAFGTDVNLTILNVSQTDLRLQDNDDVALLETISVATDGEHIVNRIYPVGGGEGLAAFDLADSTRTVADGYAINSTTGPDGRTLYYLDTGDTPIREEVRRYKITPIANSASAKEVAANALYDACAADLERSSMTQDTYSCTVAKLRKTVRAGDKVRLRYKGVIKTEAGYYTFRDIDADFWILEIRENYSLSGVTTSLVISNIDRQPMDVVDALVTAVNDVKAEKFEVKTFPVQFTNTWLDTVQYDPISGFKYANFQYTVPDILTDVSRVVIRLRTFPLDSGSGMTSYLVNATGHNLSVNTYSARNHAYYPHDVTLSINGIDRTVALGGPWGTYTAQADVELDITEYIIDASGGLYQEHDLQFYCGDQSVSVNINGPTANGTIGAGFTPNIAPNITSSNSRGKIELTINVLGNAQAIITS